MIFVDAVPVSADEDMMDIKPGKRVDVKCAFDVPVRAAKQERRARQADGQIGRYR
jgi:hypothetical protein